MRTDDTEGYNRLADAYAECMSRHDYEGAFNAAQSVRRWLGVRSNRAQILPTGDVTGQAHYLLGWADRRIEMLLRMISNDMRSRNQGA